jgi:hypothetical protein
MSKTQIYNNTYAINVLKALGIDPKHITEVKVEQLPDSLTMLTIKRYVTNEEILAIAKCTGENISN